MLVRAAAIGSVVILVCCASGEAQQITRIGVFAETSRGLIEMPRCDGIFTAGGPEPTFVEGPNCRNLPDIPDLKALLVNVPDMQISAAKMWIRGGRDIHGDLPIELPINIDTTKQPGVYRITLRPTKRFSNQTVLTDGVRDTQYNGDAIGPVQIAFGVPTFMNSPWFAISVWKRNANVSPNIGAAESKSTETMRHAEPGSNVPAPLVGLSRAISSAQETFASSCGSGFYAPSLAALTTPPNGQFPFLSEELKPLPGKTSAEYQGYQIEIRGAADPSSPASCNGLARGSLVRDFRATATIPGSSFEIVKGQVSKLP